MKVKQAMHMGVRGAEGCRRQACWHVIGAEGDRVKLISGGMDHDIDLSMVGVVENDTVRLRKTAAETVMAWH